MDWIQKKEWKKTGTNFVVVVSRYESYENEYTGKYRWCVYGYIYPDHPHFKKFEGDDLYQDAAKEMPLPAGATSIRYHFGDHSDVTSIQIGADYHHINDNRFTFYYTKEEAATVFDDAGELFEWLENYDRQ